MHLQLQQQSMMLGRKPVGFAEHYYTEWDDGLGKEKISLFLVISIASTQVPGAEVGKEAFQLLQDHFLDDLSGDPYDRFENALREVNAMVNEKEEELGMKFVPNFHVVCGVIQKDMLFLSQRGEANGYLVRKRHVSSITEGLCDEKNKEDLFQNIASGVLEVGDSVVLTTGHLVQHVTPSDLSKIFSEQPLDEAAKELNDLLGSDLEEQLAMLSFEILEKAAGAVVAEEGEEKVEDKEIKEEVEVKEKKWQKSVVALRGWLTHEERWAWVKEIKNWERKKLLTAIGVIAVVAVVGVGILYFFSGQQRTIEAMEAKLTAAEENITQAETRGAFDKAEAAVLLQEAEILAVEVLESGHLGGHASQVLDSVEEQRDYLDNVVQIDDELSLLVDFSTILGSATIQGVVPYQDRMVVYTGTEAYQVLLGEAQSPAVIDNTDRVVEADYFADRENIVMLTASGKMIEYEDGNSQFADTSDVDWHEGVDVKSYSSKIYVLDPGENQIWKYQRGTSAYGSASAYLSEEVDVSDAISFAIDGNLWVLNEDGSMTKLLSGDEVEFFINEAPLDSVEGAVKLYTELEINQLYLIDAANDRLLIYNKSSRTEDLTYSQQYILDGLRGDLVDMYVDKDRDVIILVTDTALYELGF
jgi:hypothetical protein